MLQDLAKEKLAQINEAYAVLSDAARRAQYDQRRSDSMGYGTGTAEAWARTPAESGGMARAVRQLALLAFVIAGAFLTLRLARNPRSMAIAGAALLLVWFGPRLIRMMRGRR